MTTISTLFGEVSLSHGPEALEGRDPAILVIGHRLDPADGLAGVLAAALPGTDVLSLDLPGFDGPGLVQSSLGVVARAIAEVVGGCERPLVLVGSSIGALVALAVRSPRVAGVVAIEPFFATAGRWPIIAQLREAVLPTASAEVRDFVWNVFGVDEGSVEPRSYHVVLDRVGPLTHVIAGDVPLYPQRDCALAPSLLDDLERHLLGDRGVLHIAPGAGHDVLAAAPELVVEVVQAALDQAGDDPAALRARGDQALLDDDTVAAVGFYERTLALTPPRHQAPVISRLGLASKHGQRYGPALKILRAIEAVDPVSAFVTQGMALWLRTHPGLEDPRFADLADRHADLLPIPNWHWNLGTILWAVRQVRDLPGDFVELGVFRGHTTLFTAEYVEFASWPRTWWLYDTFDGIPDDQLDPGWEQSNQVYKDTFSVEEVRARFAAFPNIRITQGRVPEVLAEDGPSAIAFLHVDLNNSAAEIAALDVLFDRIVPGGIIVFDDYAWSAARAQYEAESAWFAARGLVVLPLPTGQGVFVKG